MMLSVPLVDDVFRRCLLACSHFHRHFIDAIELLDTQSSWAAACAPNTTITSQQSVLLGSIATAFLDRQVFDFISP